MPYKLGQRVTHKKFGLGTVIAFDQTTCIRYGVTFDIYTPGPDLAFCFPEHLQTMQPQHNAQHRIYARTYEPKAHHFIDCMWCRAVCLPFPDEDSNECSLCFFEHKTLNEPYPEKEQHP